jgi:hypothetical protein
MTMHLKTRVWMMIVFLLLACAGTKSDGKDSFLLNYKGEEALVYLVEMKISTNTLSSFGDESQNQRMDVTMRYKNTLTPVQKNAGAPNALQAGKSAGAQDAVQAGKSAGAQDAVQASSMQGLQNSYSRFVMQNHDLEAHWDIDDGSMKMKITFKDDHFVGTINGEQAIDTRNGVGQQIADAMMNEMKALFEQGGVGLQADGSIDGFGGSDEFVAFWKQESQKQMGLFGIVFPEKNITIGEAWQKNLWMRSLESLILQDSVNQIFTYTRQPDTIVNNNSLAVFEMDAPLLLQNAVCYTQSTGLTPFQLDTLDRKTKATFLFDQKRGVVQSIKNASDILIDLTAEMMGSTVHTKTNLNMVMTQQLL